MFWVSNAAWVRVLFAFLFFCLVSVHEDSDAKHRPILLFIWTIDLRSLVVECCLEGKKSMDWLVFDCGRLLRKFKRCVPSGGFIFFWKRLFVQNCVQCFVLLIDCKNNTYSFEGRLRRELLKLSSRRLFASTRKGWLQRNSSSGRQIVS